MLRELREYIPSPSAAGDNKAKKDYTEYPGGLNRDKMKEAAKKKIKKKVRLEEKARAKQVVRDTEEARRAERETRVMSLAQAQEALKKSKAEGVQKVRMYEADLRAKGFRPDVEHGFLKRARVQAEKGDEALRLRITELNKAGKQDNEEMRQAKIGNQPGVVRRAVKDRVSEIEAKGGVSAEAARMIQEAQDRAKRLAKKGKSSQ